MSSAAELLSRGLSALSLQCTPSQHAALLAYLVLIDKWNRVYNLTAVRNQVDMLTLHLMDSLAVVPALRNALKVVKGGCAKKLLDVGSGAGLPGVVFAILNPGLEVICVDAVGKKASFIRQVAMELGLCNLQAEHARIEQLPSVEANIVTSRAFSNLFDFTALTAHHLAPQGVWMSMKGKVPTDELAALPNTIQMFHVEHILVPNLDAERCLVWMKVSTVAR
jgi:16S rRNA (guanine527-N7)-methyltransferase